MIELTFQHKNSDKPLNICLRQVDAKDDNTITLNGKNYIYRLPETPYNIASIDALFTALRLQSKDTNLYELSQRLLQEGAYNLCLNERIGTVSREILNTASNYRSQLEGAAAQLNEISEKQVALLLGDLFIEGSAYEGSEITRQLPFWNNLVSEWQHPTNAFSTIIHPGCSPATVERVKANLQQAKNIHELCNQITENRQSVADIDEHSIKKLLRQMKQELDSTGHCYFPLSYRGMGSRGFGHAFTLLVEKQMFKGEERILCHILNKGEGIENHNKVTIKNKKTYTDYKFTVALNVDPFTDENNEVGSALLKSLFSYRIEDTSQTHGQTPFTAEEIYSLFLAIGKKVDFDKEKEGARASTPQRSGVCADMAVRLIIRDSCLAAAASPAVALSGKEYRRMMFCARFTALLQAYASPAVVKEHPLLLLRSCEGFAQTANKLYHDNIISEDERNKSLALIELVREKAAPFAKQPSALLAADNDTALQELQPKTVELDPIEKKAEAAPLPDYPPVPGVADKPESGQALLSYLQKNKTLLDSYKGSAKDLVEQRLSYSTLAQLPVPCPGEGADAFWDAVPLAEIPETLRLLDEFCAKYLSSFEKSDAGGALYGKILATQLHAFTMIYKLASRDPENKLKGFVPTLPLENISTHLLFFHDREENDRFLNIQAFFQAMPKEGHPLLKVYDDISDARKYLDHDLKKLLPGATVLPRKEYTETDFDEAIKQVQQNNRKREENQISRSLGDELYYFYQFEDHRDTINAIQPEDGVRLLLLLDKSTPEGYELLKKHYIASSFILRTQNCIEAWEQKQSPSWNPKKQEGVQAKSLNTHNYNIIINELNDAHFLVLKHKITNGLIRTPETDSEPWHNISPMQDWDWRGLLKQNIENINQCPENKIITEYNPDNYPCLIKAPYLKEFFAILSKPELSTSNLLLWCRDNPRLTAQQDVQSLIEFAMLSGDHLTKAVQKEPHLIKNLYSYLDEQITSNLQAKTVEEALFWVSLAYHVEMRCSPAPRQERLDQLQAYLAELKQKIEATPYENGLEQKKALQLIRTHQVYLRSHAPDTSEKSLEEFLSRFLEFSTCNYKGERFTNQEEKINEALYKYQAKLPELYSAHMPQIKSAVTTFLQELGLTEQVKGIKWQEMSSSTYPHLDFSLPGKNGAMARENWSIDLFSGKVHSQGILQQQVLIDPIFSHTTVQELLGEAIFTLLRQDDDEKGNAIYFSSDGIYTVKRNRSNYDIFRTLTETGMNGKFQFTDDPFTKIGKYYIPLLQWRGVMATRNFWLAETADSQGNRYGFFTDKQSGKLLDERVCFDATGQMHMEKWREADGSAIDPPLRLLDPKTAPCGPFFAKICPENELFIWGAETVSPTGSATFSLKKVELPLRELSFTAKPDSTGIRRLFCDQQRGSYIAERPIPAVMEIVGAIPLQQPGGGGLRLLLPTGERTATTQLSTAESLPQSYTGSLAKKKYFLYEVDSETMRLLPQSSKALLQLVYALKKQGSFVEALSYINSLPASAPLSFNFVSAILGLPSNTPEAIAFDMRLALVYIHNPQDEPELSEREKKNKGLLKMTLWQSLTEKLAKYFSAKGAKASHLSAALSLSDAEEKALLHFLYPSSSKSPLWQLPNILGIQRQLSPTETSLQLKNAGEVDASEKMAVFYFHHALSIEYMSGVKNKMISKLTGKANTTPLPIAYSARVLKKDEDKNNKEFFLSLEDKNYEERFLFLVGKIKEALYTERPSPPSAEELATLDILLKNFWGSLSKNDWGDIDQKDYKKDSIRLTMSKLLFLLRFAAKGERGKVRSILHDLRVAVKHMEGWELSGKLRTINDTFSKKFWEIKLEGFPALGRGQEESYAIPVQSIPQTEAALSERSRKIAAHGSRQQRAEALAPSQQQLGASAQAPLTHMLEEWFTADLKEDPRAGQTFALQTLPFGANAPKLAQRLLNATAAEHLKEQQSLGKLATYQLKADIPAEKICSAMEEKIHTTKQQLKALRRHIEDKVNWEGDKFAALSPLQQQQALQRRLQVAGGSRIAIDINQLMLALLDPKQQVIHELNPLLNQQEVEEVMELVQRYQLESAAAAQLAQAHMLLKKGQVNEAAAILAKRRLYDIKERPELLFYEYATEQMLRPEQAALLQEIFAWEASSTDKRLLFEFQAGGGKTKVIAAILAARALLRGQVPVFFSLPELYDIVKKDLHSVLSPAFLLQTSLPRLDLAGTPEMAELIQFLDACNRSLEQHHCQVLKPETYAVLFLNYIQALKEGDNPERVELLEKILNFYRKNALFFFDESHLTLSSLLQTIIPVGTAEKMSLAETKLILAHYQWLSGNNEEGKLAHLADGRSVTEVLGLRRNQQAKLTPLEHEEILGMLTAFSKEYVEKIKETTADPKEAKALEELAYELAARVLPYTLKLVGEVDYGAGTDLSRDPIEKPYNNSKLVTADFESTNTAAALTVQGLLQRGLTKPQQMKNLLILLLNEKGTPGWVDAKKMFVAWQQAAGCPDIIKLKNVDTKRLEDDKYLQGWIDKLGNQAEVIQFFLQTLALPKLKSYPEKTSATAADLMAGGAGCLGFSATLGTPEQYPFLAETNRFLADTGFLTHVIQANNLEKNQKIAWIEPSSPKALLKELFSGDDANSERLQTLEGVIDVGAWDERCSAADWAVQANEFFIEKNLPIAGSFYFASKKSGKGKSKEVLYLLLKGDKVARPLPSTDIKSELKKLGLSEKRFFKIYDASKCTGTDLALGPDATMVLTLREGMTMATLAQAELRLRQFLKPQSPSVKGQSIVAVAPKKLRPLIYETLNSNLKTPVDKNKELSMKEICSWAILNLSEQCAQSIEARAYQEIGAVVRHAILKKMSGKSATDQIALMREHEKAFFSAIVRTQSGEIGKADTRKVLESFFTAFLDKTKVARTELSQEELRRVENIIEQTSALLETISKQEQSSSGLTQQKEMEQQHLELDMQLQNQQRQFSSTRDLKPAPELQYSKNELKLTDERLWDADRGFSSPAKARSSLLPENLWLLNNVKKIDDSGQYEKSFSYLLAVRKRGVDSGDSKSGGAWRFYACSLEDAEEYKRQLTDTTDASPCDKEICLLTIDGNLAQRGMGSFAMSEQELNNLLGSKQLAEVSLGASLLSCRITKADLPRLRALIRQNPAEAKKLWTSVAKRHLNLDPQIDRWMTKLLKEAL